MDEMDEIEVFGEFNLEELERCKAILEKRIGKAKVQKRVKFSYWNPEFNKNIDLQIRITNKNAEIMHKAGEWENSDIQQFSEKSFRIESNVEQILGALSVFNSLFALPDGPSIQQYSSLIWEDENFNYKLGTQFNNKNTRYIFDVEIINPKVNKADLLEKVEELGLTKFILNTDVEFWAKWENSVNMRLNSLNEDEIIKLIKSSL